MQVCHFMKNYFPLKTNKMYLIIFYLFSQWNVYNYLLIIMISMHINLAMVWTYNWLWVLNASLNYARDLRLSLQSEDLGLLECDPLSLCEWFGFQHFEGRDCLHLWVKQSNFTFMRLSIVCFWAGCELQTHFFCCWQNVNGCDSCIELHKLCLLWIVKMKLSSRPNVGVIRFWG